MAVHDVIFSRPYYDGHETYERGKREYYKDEICVQTYNGSETLREKARTKRWIERIFLPSRENI